MESQASALMGWKDKRGGGDGAIPSRLNVVADYLGGELISMMWLTNTYPGTLLSGTRNRGGLTSLTVLNLNEQIRI